jgi:hypothetical protein
MAKSHCSKNGGLCIDEARTLGYDNHGQEEGQKSCSETMKDSGICFFPKWNPATFVLLWIFQ